MTKDTKAILREALRRGWTLHNGKTHKILIHPSGRKVSFSGTPSCPHAAKNFKTDIERIEKWYESQKR